jgi:hypothetical protein
LSPNDDVLPAVREIGGRMNDQRFYAYVRSQARRDDAVGRLARSLMFDARRKRALRLTTVQSVRTHLAARDAGADALAGLATAAAEYAARARPLVTRRGEQGAGTGAGDA